MIEADAEWYLRRCAEDELLSRSDESTLRFRAQALVAVGLLTHQTSRAIMDSYDRARELRGLEPNGHGYERLPAGELTSLRVSAPARTITQPWGTITVHHVTQTERHTRMRVTMTGTPSGTQSGATVGGVPAGAPPFPAQAPITARIRRAYPLHHHPPTLTVTDDRGHRHTAHFSGGGSDDDWDGQFDLGPRLPIDTAWIRIFGERIDLADNPSDVTIVVETASQDAPIADRAARYLTLCLETSDEWNVIGSVATAVDVFVSCGVLVADAASVAEARAVADLLSRRRSGPLPASADRWRAVLARRGRTDGAVGSRAVGATTPALDGVRIAVLHLRANASDVAVDVETVGSIREPHERGMPAVTAADDAGNHYVGDWDQWSANGEGLSGTIRLQAPLDPSATTLDLCFSTVNARAVVQIPLRWDVVS